MHHVNRDQATHNLTRPMTAATGGVCDDEVDGHPKATAVKPMKIHLRPEIERLIQRDVERGPYQTMDEFVEQAVQMLHAQEEWLSANRSDIRAKIEAGYAAAQRGELIDDAEIRARMEQRKRVWQSDQSKA
jgi:putative addiction module CopG family antidote